MSLDKHYAGDAALGELRRGLGGKSYTYEMRIHEADSMTHCATQKTVAVCFDTRCAVSRTRPVSFGSSRRIGRAEVLPYDVAR